MKELQHPPLRFHDCFRDQHLTRAEGDGLDVPLVAFVNGQLLAGGHVPQPRGRKAGGEQLRGRVRAEREGLVP